MLRALLTLGLLLLAHALDYDLPNHNNPLYRVTVTDSGFSSMLQAMQDVLMELISSEAMPEISSTIDLEGLGDISFDIDNIIFDNVNVLYIDGNIDVDAEEIIGMAGLDVKVTFTWSWNQLQYPYLSDGGTAEASITGIDIVSHAQILRDPDHYVSAVNCTQVELQIASFTIQIHGELEFLYDLFCALFEDEFIKLIELVGVQFMEYEMAHIFSHFHEIHNLDHFVTFDERMTSPSAGWGDHYFFIDFYGDIYTRDQPSLALNQPTAISLPAIQTDHGVQTFMDVGQWRDTIQAHHIEQAFTGTVTRDGVPPELLALFDGSVVSALVPELYPYADQAFQYRLYSNDMPTADVYPVALLVGANVTACVQVEGEDTDLLCMRALVSLTSQVQPASAPSFDEGVNRIGTNSTLYGVGPITVTHSLVGTVQITSDLTALLTILLQETVPATLDTVMLSGGPVYPLGFLGCDPGSWAAVYGEDYVLLAASITPKD